MTATVCIPWRPTPDRLPAYQRCTHYWTAHGYPIITADSKPSQPFNRAAARNNAANQATTDTIILADADTLPAHISQITTAINITTKTCGAAWPYTTYRLLPHDAVTATDLTAITPIRDYNLTRRPGGLTVINRHAYHTIGGYDPRFGAGWGYEDGAFHLACQTLLDTQHLPGVAYAFNHDGPRTRDQRNKRRYGWYKRAEGKPEHMRRIIGLPQNTSHA